MKPNGGEPAGMTRGEARRGFRVGKCAGVRAAGVALLSALAASCAKPDHAEAGAMLRGEIPRAPEVAHETAPASALTLVSRTTDARGVRHYVFSDGSELALDPLEPLNTTSDRQR